MPRREQDRQRDGRGPGHCQGEAGADRDAGDQPHSQGWAGRQTELHGNWQANAKHLLGEGGSLLCPLPGNVSRKRPCYGGRRPQDTVSLFRARQK